MNVVLIYTGSYTKQTLAYLSEASVTKKNSFVTPRLDDLPLDSSLPFDGCHHQQERASQSHERSGQGHSGVNVIKLGLQHFGKMS
jgi:hypothetical protein